MLKLLGLLLISILCLWGVIGHASAHQSGCHRWHSCPSDTGSYVCGDLGYDSECGSEDIAEPDYSQQGMDNGSLAAENDTASIQNTAKNDAQQNGYDDGSSGYSDDPSPDSTDTCDKNFDFSSPQPQEYVDAYHDSYLDTCTDIYNSAYDDAYESAYEEGANGNNNSDNIENTSSKNSDNSGYWILGGIALLIGGPALYDKLRKK